MKFKPFSQYVKETIYVVELQRTKFFKAFVLREEANKYWDEQFKIENEPKMHNINIADLDKYLNDEQIKQFVDAHPMLQDKI